MGQVSFRLAFSAALAVTLLVVPFAGTSRAHICTPDPEVPAPGSLLIPQASGLARFSFADRLVETLPVLPSSGLVSQVARSSDGTRLALARFSRTEGESIGGSDVLITGPDGGAVLDRLERTRPGELIAAPAWHPRGGLVFERSTVSGGTSAARIEWRQADDAMVTLVERGASPTVSHDGRWLAYIHAQQGDRLMLRDLAGGEERVLVADTAFLAIAFPRFSPNGEWLAFAAAGEPVAAPLPSVGLTGWRPGPALAQAHGVPWDTWAVRVSDGVVTRLSSYYDDDPAVAWSPDGWWVAMFAGESIKAIAVDGSASYCVLGTGGYGGLEWIE